METIERYNDKALFAPLALFFHLKIFFIVKSLHRFHRFSCCSIIGDKTFLG